MSPPPTTLRMASRRCTSTRNPTSFAPTLHHPHRPTTAAPATTATGMTAAPRPPGHWRRPDRDNARDPHRDRDPDRPSPPRPNRPDRREPDREPQGGEPSRKPTPQGPDRVWRDARPPAQGQSAEDGRGPGGRPSMPGARP